LSGKCSKIVEVSFDFTHCESKIVIHKPIWNIKLMPRVGLKYARAKFMHS
jgi:hypothetical protein